MSKLPLMLFGDELKKSMSYLPEFDDSIREKSQTDRLIALNDLHSLYFTSSQAVELYTKLYLSLQRTKQKMESDDATKQLYENAKRIKETSYVNKFESNSNSSFSLVGPSGCGKSTTIARIKYLLEEENNDSLVLIIVEVPFDCSIKSLLLEILRQIDIKVGSKYYEFACKSRIATIDVLIGNVSNCIINHKILGIVFDECQNMIRSNSGLNLLNCLTQIINSSSCTIVFCGTPEVTEFFSRTFYIARRTTGLTLNVLEYRDFKDICHQLFEYQYCINKVEINNVFIDWLWMHSQGNISVLITLFHDAQEYAILEGLERLSIESLNKAFRQRLHHLKSFIHLDEGKSLGRAKNSNLEHIEYANSFDMTIYVIQETIYKAKKRKCDIQDALSKIILIESV